MLSAVVLTKNEQENLIRCLDSISWVDEIVIVDDNSTDGTLEVAKKFNTKIFKRGLNENFSEQRNYGLEKAGGDWVLFVDADEEVSKRLQEEIIEVIKEEGINGFFLKRKDIFLGKWLKYGETSAVRLLRLGKKGTGAWIGQVDEVWEIKGKKKTLSSPLLHYSHLKLEKFLKTINERSTLNAKKFYNENKKISLIDWFKPFLKFVQNYFLRFGFLDGIHGFIFAVLMSFHSFLVRGKLYLIWKEKGGWK